jgi:hypothetical protein
MSKINTYINDEVSVPIMISPKNNKSEGYNNQFNNIYKFILNINLKNGKEHKISTYEINKSSILITSKDKILFNEIITYSITVNVNNTIHTLEGKINEDSTYSINNENGLFIEFSQDDNGYVNCTCHLINKDLNLLCITP